MKISKSPTIWPDEIARVVYEEDPDRYVVPEEYAEDGVPLPDPATYNPYHAFLQDPFLRGWDFTYFQQFKPTSPCGCGREFERADQYVDHAEDCLQADGSYRNDPMYRGVWARRQYLAQKLRIEGRA
ncbi:hypothetical protein ACTWJ8_30730 [Streptomyces sp. SDT5-1]|uniref:hypothetical protein n=1 Tax=Streptomyces sp. SDT5-1 TaxID=3406418 RepID=UPI003FCF2F28